MYILYIYIYIYTHTYTYIYFNISHASSDQKFKPVLNKTRGLGVPGRVEDPTANLPRALQLIATSYEWQTAIRVVIITCDMNSHHDAPCTDNQHHIQ